MSNAQCACVSLTGHWNFTVGHWCVRVVAQMDPVFSSPCNSLPICYSSDPLSIADIRPPPPVVVKLLGNLLVQCRRCNTKAENYTLHTQSGCDQYIYVPPITIQHMLSHPLSHPPKAPVLESEWQITGKIVTRLVHRPDDTLTVPTRGKVTCGIPLLNRVAWFQGSYSQPLTLMRVPKATVPTSKASAKTIAWRNQALHQLRDTISGRDSSSQMQEIRSLSTGRVAENYERGQPHHRYTTKTWCGHEGRLGSPMEQAPNLAQVGISSQSHFYESMIISLFIHKFSLQYNVVYCKDQEKEGTLLLASYVHGLTDYYGSIKIKLCTVSMTIPALS